MDARVEELHSQARSLAAKFKEGGETTVKHIHEAIVLDREALKLCSPGHHKRAVSLTQLSIHLSTRYEGLGDMEDLEEAIILDREALQLHPHGHPDRSYSLNRLAVDLWTRCCELEAVQDLEESIVLDREALQLRPQGHPDRATSLNNLAVHLGTRYDTFGALQDLDEAIILDQEALRLCPHGHPDRCTPLNNLAAELWTRYKRSGVMQDLDEAIVLNRETLQLHSRHPPRFMSLNNLAVCLCARYDKIGSMQDLNEAIVLVREALQLQPQKHPRRSISLSSLAVHLRTRYRKLGAMDDLEEATVLDREALQLRPRGHPDRLGSLNNLAVDLWTRYRKLGTMQDLEVAISLDREALQLCSEGHPGRSTSLNCLAVHLGARYEKIGAMQDLNEAIVRDREALQLQPQEHPDRPISLNSLAIHLGIRYEMLGAMHDLDEAIVLDQEALQLRPHGHSDRSMSLNNLAIRLSTRYKKLGAMQDLEEAISLHREALQLRPPGHSDHFISLNNLALGLRTRYHKLEAQLSQSKDVDEIFALYAQLADVHMVSSDHLLASRAWICAAEGFQHSSVIPAYETSLRLLALHMSILPSLPQHLDILRTHTSSLAVDAFSACLRHRAKEHAVELLEQGRGVFWNQLARLRSPLDDVITSGPAGKSLANEFNQLTLLIRNVLDSPGVDQHEQLWRLNLKMQNVVTAIRTLTGLSRFLLPPLFSDLRSAAGSGPVIIVNASQYGCDALLVFIDRDPVHIPLSITKEYVRLLSANLRTQTARSQSPGMIKVLGRTLRELWEDVVSPIANFLQTIHPLGSRIWWCPTAEFSDLPLHAAGPYRKGEKNLPNLYISSYTPTLRALIHARRANSSASSSASASNAERFIAIGQANADGQIELPSVHAELDIVGQLIQDLATFTQIEGEESCISRVVEELGKNAWVHFACHGLPNRRKPFESAFALGDGHLMVEHIMGCNLENAEFAYLSACHTTVGDEESPDEAIHLAAAMQFAGFRSVVGTMWAVDDSVTNKITSTFYRYLVDDDPGRLDPTRAAFALNKAVRSPGVTLDQRALYIHIGV